MLPSSERLVFVKNSLFSTLVLMSLSVTACSFLNSDNGTTNGKYIGSITLSGDNLRPVHLSLDNLGNFIVSAQGSQKGEIWSAARGVTQMGPKEILDQGQTYGFFYGHAFDSNSQNLYVCSNSSVDTVNPSVVVFQRKDDGTYSWTAAVNFPQEGFCNSVIKVKNYLFASNSQAKNIQQPALYFDTLEDSSALPTHGTFGQTVSYADMGYQAGDLKENNITYLSSSKQGTGTPSFYITDTGRTKLFLASLNDTPPFVLNKTEIAIPFPSSGTLSAVVEYASQIYLFAQNTGDKGTLYKAKLSLDKKTYDVTSVAQTESSVLSMETGSDNFGKTQDPVVFALNESPNSDKLYHVDEFTFDEKNPVSLY